MSGRQRSRVAGSGKGGVTTSGDGSAGLADTEALADYIEKGSGESTLPDLSLPTPDSRTPAQHATDRVLYSDALRRLGGVTQVVAVKEKSLFHTRLTHTLKVAQIARRLAQHLATTNAGQPILANLGSIDPDIAEAAGLAHDLGHPPFGHVGETVLNERCERWGLDGFEGNAQTFRLLTKILRRDPDTPGLGLAPEVLNAVIKYPWLREGDKLGASKWNAYRTERHEFRIARETAHERAQSPEAAVMDWADDVTYAVHDVEDFIRAGRIPMARLVYDSVERAAFAAEATARVAKKVPGMTKEAIAAEFNSLIAWAYRWMRSYPASDLPRLRRTSSILINLFLGAVTLGTREEPLHVPPAIRAQVEMLKQLTWYYVIHDPALATLQRGHQRVVRGLFDDLMRWMPEEKRAGALHRLPRVLLERWEFTKSEQKDGDYPNKKARRARAVADYISSLTEDQAVDLYARLRGGADPSVLESWLDY